MELAVELELTDIYGGDGFERLVRVEDTKLRRTKKTRETKASLGISVEDTKEETKTEMKDDVVHTFRLIDGKPHLRLGGAHGKAWGAIRDTAQKLRTFGDPDFKSYYAIVESIVVSPQWVPLEFDGNPMTEEKIPQILQGFRSTMIILRYDVIPKCTVHIRFFFPPAIRRHVEKLLTSLETGSHFNKRRTTIRVVRVEEVNATSE